MALNLSQKQNVVAEVAEVAAKAHSLIAAEYIGTTVSQMTAMRKQARETGVFLKVVKNTLAARAVTGTEYECAKDALVGPLLYAFSTEEPGAAGRLIKEFAKGNDKLQPKLVVVGGPAVSRLPTSTCWLRCRPSTRPWPCWPASCPSPRRCSPVRSRQSATSRVAVMNAAGGEAAAEAAESGLISRKDNVSLSTQNQSRGNTMSLSNEQIVDAIAAKSLMEVMELVKAIEEKFGVSAAAPVAAAAAAGPAAAVEEQTEFNVILKSPGDKKVEVIKAVRADHRPRPEGSQGPGRGRRRRQGRRHQGRSREDQEGS